MYLRLLVRHFIDDDTQQKAASLTYTTLLALVPILTVVLVIFQACLHLRGLREQVQQTISANLFPTASEQVAGYIRSFAEKSSNLGLVGVAGLFVTAIMTLNTIEYALIRFGVSKNAQAVLPALYATGQSSL